MKRTISRIKESISILPSTIFSFISINNYHIHKHQSIYDMEKNPENKLYYSTCKANIAKFHC